MEEIIKPYGYIYKTTNLINGKIYIGKKESPEFDPNYKGSGKAIRAALKKYGKENFKVEFLIFCFSKEELNAEERFLIAWFDCRVKNGKGYNISEGGDWGNVTDGMTSEQYQSYCRKIGDAHRGRPKSEKHKQKLRESNLGKEVPDEVREKLRLSHLGKSRSLESRIKQGNSIRGEKNCNYGKPLDEATKNKIRESRSWYRPSEETKAKVSQAMLGENNHFYGKHHTEESRKKMSEIAKARYADPNYTDPRKGTTRSAETKARISEARRKSKFRVNCKQCGQEFLASSPNKYQLCPNCKEVVL